MEHAEQESKQHFESGLYCAESVLLAVANHLDVSSELIPRIATGFCTGLSGTSGMCGALAGGIMGLNLAYGRSQGSEPVEKNYAMVRTLRKRFEDRFGATNCTQLLGCDMGTAEGEAIFKEQGLAARCVQLVGNATRMAIELIEQE